MEEQKEVKNQNKKKLHIGEALKAFAQKIIDVFRDYPVTMLSIMIAALIGTVLVTWNSHETKIYLERAAAFFLITAMQAIGLEEIFASKKLIRFSGYGIAAVLSALYVFLLSYEEDVLFGLNTEMVDDIVIRVLFIHGLTLLALSIHHMYRRLEEDFEIYATKAFLELIKSTVVYGLFALGLALLIWIFNELIFDTDDLLAQVELFLAGGIYVPMCLKAISGKNEVPGKFSRVCFLYALQPMLLLAFAIIYIYIIKIFLTNDFPSNQIFYILAFLFAIGMPIWTIVHGMKQKEGFFSKALAFLPYLFLPFVLLQSWSIGVRIHAYGLTESRYWAIILILFEVIYFVLYLLHHRGNKNAISWLLYAMIAISVITLLFPGISFDDMVIRSQMKRMTSMMESSKPDRAAIKSSYRVIQRCSYRGEKTLKTKLTDAQIEQIKSYDEYGDLTETRVYLYANQSLTDVDISAYSRLYQANSYRDNPKDGKVIILYYPSAESKTKEKMEVDLSEYLSWVVHSFKKSYDSSFTLKNHCLFHVNDQWDLYATSISIDFNSDTYEIKNLSIDGYLFEK